MVIRLLRRRRAARHAARHAADLRSRLVFEMRTAHHRRECFSDCPFYHPLPVDTLQA